jgi:hypothetical protein
VTLRNKLEQACSSGAPRDPLLEKEISIPIEGLYLFELFWKLRSGIGGSGFGPNPISQLEIRCYVMNFGIDLSPGEIEILQKLDREYMEHSAKQSEKNKG